MPKHRSSHKYSLALNYIYESVNFINDIKLQVSKRKKISIKFSESPISSSITSLYSNRVLISNEIPQEESVKLFCLQIEGDNLDLLFSLRDRYINDQCWLRQDPCTDCSKMLTEICGSLPREFREDKKNKKVCLKVEQQKVRFRISPLATFTTHKSTPANDQVMENGQVLCFYFNKSQVKFLETIPSGFFGGNYNAFTVSGPPKTVLDRLESPKSSANERHVVLHFESDDPQTLCNIIDIYTSPPDTNRTTGEILNVVDKKAIRGLKFQDSAMVLMITPTTNWYNITPCVDLYAPELV